MKNHDVSKSLLCLLLSVGVFVALHSQLNAAKWHCSPLFPKGWNHLHAQKRSTIIHISMKKQNREENGRKYS